MPTAQRNDGETLALIGLDEHVLMRQTARNYLGKLGVGTNPGFTDHNIVSRLRERLDLEAIEPWDEAIDNVHAGTVLKNKLTNIFDEAGIPIYSEPVTAEDIVLAFKHLDSQPQLRPIYWHAEDTDRQGLLDTTLARAAHDYWQQT